MKLSTSPFPSLLSLVAVTQLASGCTDFIEAETSGTDSSTSSGDSGDTDSIGSNSSPTTSPSSTVTGGSGGGSGASQADTTSSADESSSGAADSTGIDECMAITPVGLLELFELEDCEEVLPQDLCELPDEPLTRGEFILALERFSLPFELAGFNRDVTNNFGFPDTRFSDVPEGSSLWLSVQPFYWRGVLEGVYSQKEDAFEPDELACSDWHLQVWENYQGLSELYCVFSEEYDDFNVGINTNFWNALEFACFGTYAVFDDDGELDLSESRLLATEENPLVVENDPGDDGVLDPVPTSIIDAIRLNCIDGLGDDTQVLTIEGDGSASFTQLPCYTSAGVEDIQGLTILLQGSTGVERAFGTEFAFDILFPDTVELIESDPGAHRTVVTLVEAP